MTLPHENKESGGSQGEAKETQARPEDDRVEESAGVKAEDQEQETADPADGE